MKVFVDSAGSHSKTNEWSLATYLSTFPLLSTMSLLQLVSDSQAVIWHHLHQFRTWSTKI